MNLFISFDWDDLDKVNGFRGMLANPTVNQLLHKDGSVKVDFSEYGSQTIKDHITQKIRLGETTVCLVSQKTKNSKWVNWELEQSRILSKPIVGIVLPGHGVTTLAGMPEFFTRYPSCPWYQWGTPAELAAALRSARRAA